MKTLTNNFGTRLLISCIQCIIALGILWIHLPLLTYDLEKANFFVNHLYDSILHWPLAVLKTTCNSTNCLFILEGLHLMIIGCVFGDDQKYFTSMAPCLKTS